MLSKNGFISVFALLALFWAMGAAPIFGAGWKILPGHVPAMASRLTPTGELPATNELRLAIGLPLRDAAGLDAFLAGVSDPASPKFRRYLTPEEFTALFGPTEADYAAVKAFALANGLTITATHGNRLVLDVRGSAARVERAFRLHLQKFQHPSEAREFFAPDVEPSVDLGLPVADVAGLSDYERPRSKLRPVEAVARLAKAMPRTGSGAGGSFLGTDFRNAYAAGTTLTGAGQMVGLVQFDGFYSNDIIAYENLLPGSPRVSLETVLLDGFNGTPTSSGGNAEVSLDIELAIAMAPGLAKVVVFEAPQSGGQPNDILNAMAARNEIKNLSCSWGWSGRQNVTTENIFKQMAAQGQSFFNASGDSDAFTPGQVDDPTQASSPSASPNITQVGGTVLQMNGAGDSYTSETVWNSGGGTGSSGGVSSANPIPSWQQGLSMTANHGSTTGRNIPDVAMVAENAYVAYGNGGNGAFVGTSCAAPLWAGFMALVNQQSVAAGNPPVGFINPAIYALGRSPDSNRYFQDTIAGDNSWSSSPTNYPATTGYDLCTGWGSPNGTNLINALAAFNLSAHLADTVRPTVSILSPVNNLKWSNTLFTVSGRAGDNVSVSNVFYSVNGAAWEAASISNHGSNWMSQITLAPGTNSIQAYALDTSGNRSITNRVSLICILSAPLMVSNNGRGSISPGYNGASLQIGATYTLTATAAAGFRFSGWTDGNGQALTNSAVLTFVMASNLEFTATFVDIARPTNVIMAPVANQHWSNSVFTVSGKAGDNVAVETVLYSLNGGEWKPASAANNWSNWMAGLTLTPGTNLIQAYTVDSAGNVSTTNRVSCVYVVSAPLKVSTNGRGSVSPNYNGALLQLGASYALTATAATGFKFAGWTDALGRAVTNNSALSFVMSPERAFTANFVDVAKPTNVIVSPVANQRWSNSLFAVTGRAVDNAGIVSVLYSLNDSDWSLAASGNNWSNWTAGVALIPGTNSLRSYAIDGAGNLSATNRVSFVYILSAPLVVSTNGRGSVSPNYNNALLQIGANYTITASAASGFKFIGWTDGEGQLVTNSAALRFLMTSNLTFRASFTDSSKPTLTIARPANNQKWSNYLCTISGRANDNVAVANVFYSLNGSEWAAPLTSDNWTNWTAQVNLVPGTNTLAVCAVDTAGNISATNKVSLVYVFAMGGVWNVAQFQTPAQMAWDSYNGLAGGSSFGETNGTISFYPDGTLSGQFENSFAGTYVQGSNGLVAVTIVTPAATNYFNLLINASQDTMTLLEAHLDAANNQQELLLFLRAPVTNTTSGMAGSWNIVQCQTPGQMTWAAVSGLQAGDNFAATNGSLVLNANGSISGNLAGTFTGSYRVSSNGVINLATVAGGQTNCHTLHVNASRSTMSLVEGPVDSADAAQQLTILQRVPASLSPTDLVGWWNVQRFQTPDQLTWDSNNGLLGGGNFGAASGLLRFNANGTISGNLNGAFTGTYRTGNAGSIKLTMVAGSETSSFTVYLNVSKDAMTGVSSRFDGQHHFQQLLLLQRVPGN